MRPLVTVKYTPRGTCKTPALPHFQCIPNMSKVCNTLHCSFVRSKKEIIGTAIEILGLYRPALARNSVSGNNEPKHRVPGLPGWNEYAR